jgi:hypothetical protein
VRRRGVEDKVRPDAPVKCSSPHAHATIRRIDTAEAKVPASSSSSPTERAAALFSGAGQGC